MRAYFFGWMLLAAMSVPFAAFGASPPHVYRATRERLLDLNGLPADQRALVLQVRGAVYSAVVPDLSGRHIPAAVVLDACQQPFREHNPEHYSLGFFLKWRADCPPLVSLNLHSATIAEVLDKVCARDNYNWAVEASALVIVPAEECGSKPAHTAR